MIRHAVEPAFDRRSLDFTRRRPHAPAMARRPQIVAFGGGGFSMEAGNPLLDDYVLGARPASSGPRVCFVPTASGDADHYIVRFYRAFPSAICEPSHVSLFRRDQGGGIDCDVAGHLLAQDLIYVGGGSVVSLLGVWRAHGLDEVLRQRLAARDRPVRPERRLAVLVPGGASPRSTARATRRRGPRPAAVLELRPLRRRARRGGPSTARASTTAMTPRLRRRRRRRAALRRHAS